LVTISELNESVGGFDNIAEHHAIEFRSQLYPTPAFPKRNPKPAFSFLEIAAQIVYRAVTGPALPKGLKRGLCICSNFTSPLFDSLFMTGHLGFFQPRIHIDFHGMITSLAKFEV